MSLTLQYVIVGLVIAAVIARIVFLLVKRKNPPSGCCGCPLEENCKSRDNSNSI